MYLGMKHLIPFPTSTFYFQYFTVGLPWLSVVKNPPAGVLCLPGDQSHPFAQPSINPLACCICWAGLLGRAVFPPWDKGPNFGSKARILGLTLCIRGHEQATLDLPIRFPYPGLQIEN